MDLALVDAQGSRDAAVIADEGVQALGLLMTEVMSKNDGAWLDEFGEADDWIEIKNVTDGFINLGQYAVSDSGAVPHMLPRLLMEPGEIRLLWADGDLDQGRFHLPFRLSADGETVSLWHQDRAIQQIELPRLQDNEAYRIDSDGQWSVCLWASPGQDNPERCGPAPTGGLGENDVFESFVWPDQWPRAPQPLTIAELSIHDAPFVEILNLSDTVVDLTLFELNLHVHRPGTPFPTPDDNARIPWPDDTTSLDVGERVLVRIEQSLVDGLAANQYEGVLSLWFAGTDDPVERLDFMAWPEGAVLARSPTPAARHRFCLVSTPGQANDQCEPLQSRLFVDRLRHLRTPTDFDMLADGDTAVGTQSVKFVIDRESSHATHLMSTRQWDLHYTFVRETIDGLPHLDRCIPEEAAAFRDGWVAFSDVNYSGDEDRRYLLGTLTRYGSNGLKTVEFAAGDEASGALWLEAFFSIMGSVFTPKDHAIRPRTSQQVETLRTVEGEVPIVGRLTPFEGITYQPLTQTLGYGVLTYIPVSELATASLGPQVIVLTDEVPNDIDLVGGLITEAFQTPLAHVNLLSRNRDTPNMALVDARNDDRVAPFLGQLIRLDVSGAAFTIEIADPVDAEAFWRERQPNHERVAPELDRTRRGVIPLDQVQIADVPSVGAKAAQLAHLALLANSGETCATQFDVPNAPMAIPVVHSIEHYAASGAQERLVELEADAAFRNDPQVRAAGLQEIRQLITAHPVDSVILGEVEDYIRREFGTLRVRFRSSSNTEDLANFNGAGLYTSISGQINDDSRTIDDAMRTVWASLYLRRAYDERRYYNIDERQVAMGVLVHPAFLSERANGVAISRNILQPTRRQTYLNVQLGEASVANPAPGITTDQIVHDIAYQPEISYLARSNLSPLAPVLSDAEVRRIACVTRGIQAHFKPVLDPDDSQDWFAMDIEFKRVGPEQNLVVKQARPYSFGSAEIPTDCR